MTQFPLDSKAAAETIPSRRRPHRGRRRVLGGTSIGELTELRDGTCVYARFSGKCSDERLDSGIADLSESRCRANTINLITIP